LVTLKRGARISVGGALLPGTALFAAEDLHFDPGSTDFDIPAPVRAVVLYSADCPSDDGLGDH
jgi:hypothetical protein